ncbi:TlpA disulfide reductase family protein [Saccharomonospora xinjiangensis]|uniref:Thiol-disulfide isomerase-like thioredoxin n=1 Tax=Saccharomonospora xinjiangensis XJ-54 TaxID=882086 RepID=I0V1H2_9PSEU|nr:TlpA disulfide reductase family protein [Saccharomonospora xinjiangensis]EID53975.1 thiol-disulfide isomerase-like thioredoxin [Saccharomonospora xinjiangensis XJ-54]
MRSGRVRAGLVAAVTAMAVALTGCATGDDAVASGGDFSFVAPGGKSDIYYEGEQRQRLPEVAGEDLFDEGKRLSAADYKGKVLVINIWGQWCGPCRTEAPEMQKLYEEHADDGVVVLGIDVRDHDRSAPQDFMRDRGLTYPSIYDPSGRSLVNLSGYPRSVVPSTIVVDRQGRVAAVFLRDLLAEDLRPLVTRLAGEKPS